MNGIMTPTLATSKDFIPTNIISESLDSNPTSKRRMITPKDENISRIELFFKKSKPLKPNKEKLAKVTPANNSPSTKGCLKLFAKIAPTLAANMTMDKPRRTLTIGSRCMT
jgi:hypothetical protein